LQGKALRQKQVARSTERLTEIAWNQIEATNDFKYGAIGREIRMESAA
jgi:hypothetical protein